MPRKRDMLRADEKTLHTLRRSSVNRKIAESKLAISRAVTRSRELLNDHRFLEVLRDENVDTMPVVGHECTAANPTDPALEFMIVWAFFYPLFAKPVITTYLQDNWPGFIWEMKDAFIDFVFNGPFRRPYKNDWISS